MRTPTEGSDLFLHMLIQRNLRRPDQILHKLDLLRGAGFEHLGNGLDHCASGRGLFFKKQIIRANPQRIGKGNKNRQAELGISGFNMAHMCSGDPDLFRQIFLRKALRFSDFSDPLSDFVVVHPSTAYTVYFHLHYIGNNGRILINCVGYNMSNQFILPKGTIHMTTEQKAPSLIVQSDTNPTKAMASWLPFSVIAILIGVLVSNVGFSSLWDVPSYAPDSEEVLPIVIIVFGTFSWISGIVYPFIARSIAKKHSLRVFDDHIEGTGIVIAGGIQSIVGFYEKTAMISGIALAGQKLVAIYLTNGNSIRCLAYNAQEIVTATRQLIDRR